MSYLQKKFKKGFIFTWLEKLLIKKRILLLTALSSFTILLVTSIIFSFYLYNKLYEERKNLLKETTKIVYDTIKVYSDKEDAGLITRQ